MKYTPLTSPVTRYQTISVSFSLAYGTTNFFSYYEPAQHFGAFFHSQNTQMIRKDWSVPYIQHVSQNSHHLVALRTKHPLTIRHDKNTIALSQLNEDCVIFSVFGAGQQPFCDLINVAFGFPKY